MMNKVTTELLIVAHLDSTAPYMTDPNTAKAPTTTEKIVNTGARSIEAMPMVAVTMPILGLNVRYRKNCKMPINIAAKMYTF
jgi:hypothetical protein